MPRVIHCILHNLVHDQRLHKMALATMQVCETEVIGVITPRTRQSVGERPYHVRRLWLPFRRGPFFFLLGNVRFFLHLLLKPRWDAVIACDLAALPGTWLAARLRRKALLLDSRELFTQTPFLVGRTFPRRIWEALERFLYPRVRYIATVSPPIARYFEQRYKKSVWLFYNFPLRGRGFARPRLENRLLLYQGMLHPYRGLEELILALGYVQGWKLWIVGDGPLRPYLEKLVRQQRLGGRVSFFGMVPFELVGGYTCQATFGVSGELPRGLNHRFALPNKVFDYLQQGIPVLVGEAPLIQAVVRHYGCGQVVESWQPRQIAQTLQAMESSYDDYARWVEGARRAAKELHWEIQVPCIQAWLRAALEGRPLLPQRQESVCVSVSGIERVIRRSD